MASARPVAGVIVYVIRQFPGEPKVLFLKRSGGQHIDAWWPVAGTPVAGEKPVQTAVRELEEETGLTPCRLFSFGILTSAFPGGSGWAQVVDSIT